MKVLIINSPLFRDFNPNYDEDSLPPLGLGYIGTKLRLHGIEVSLLDAVFGRIPLNDLINQINKDRPDFIAINVFTTNKDLVKEMVEGVNYKTHFIIGGLSTKSLYKEVLQWETENPVDIVTGDGELITLAIVTNTVSQLPFIEKGNRRVFQVNDDSMYLVRDISNVPLDRSFFLNEPLKHELGFTEANIVASRGCVFNCAFCAAARSGNTERKPRERTDESLIAELSELNDLFPEVNSIRVLDDLFLKGNKNIHQAINVFSRFRYQWRSMAHVSTFNGASDEMMKALKKSGCHELFIGIESGSPKILKEIHKTHDLDLIGRNLSKVFRAGINIKGYFIYGFPGETEQDMSMTYNLALRLKRIAMEYEVNFRTSVFQFRPYDGTELHHRLESDGANLKVQQVMPNPELSDLVGRLQFNFHSGNYSTVDNQVLNSYIYRTTNLNGGKLFADLQPYWQPVQE
jgi:anaerobic magnesium-protoporphyrin IX monomethyl ester cyclase